MDGALIASINAMIVNGNRLELPTDCIFKNYAQVKKAMLKAGGKYKKNGFDFQTDAAEIKARLTGGEVIDDKKKFQYFPTPARLAAKLVRMAGIVDGDKVLEPSAGQGAILGMMCSRTEHCVAVELMPENVKVLRSEGYGVRQADFLEMTVEDLGRFTKIVANPPFTKNQDIDHILHMLTFLQPQGKLVSVASTSWIHGSQKKQVAFREMLEEANATITELPAGTFKESGTNVVTTIIEITKQ